MGKNKNEEFFEKIFRSYLAMIETGKEAKTHSSFALEEAVKPGNEQHVNKYMYFHLLAEKVDLEAQKDICNLEHSVDKCLASSKFKPNLEYFSKKYFTYYNIIRKSFSFF